MRVCINKYFKLVQDTQRVKNLPDKKWKLIFQELFHPGLDIWHQPQFDQGRQDRVGPENHIINVNSEQKVISSEEMRQESYFSNMN